VEIQRLVVEASNNALTLDLHTGLTVAFHENPALRTRCLSDLIEAMGPARAGYHLEVVDGEHRHLVVFRPQGGAPRVIDIDRSEDLTEQFRAEDGSVDLLRWVGLDEETSQRLLRIGARQLDRGFDTGTDDHPLARRLAAIDQVELWAAADELTRAEEELQRAGQELPVDDLDEVTAFESVVELHDETEAQLQAHRPVQRIGPLMSVACIVVGAVLSALRTQVGDNQFTADALLVLGALAAAVTVGDLVLIRRIRRRERAALAERGVRNFAALAAAVGPMADGDRRLALLDAAAARQAAVTRWDELTAAAPVEWAQRYRREVTALAVRKRELSRLGAHQLAAEDSAVADLARVLVDKVIELRAIGPHQERLPLLLDEPFAGLAPAAVQQLLSTVQRLAAYHQVVLVTGDPYIEAWATQGPAADGVHFVRLSRSPASAGDDPDGEPVAAPSTSHAATATGVPSRR